MSQPYIPTAQDWATANPAAQTAIDALITQANSDIASATNKAVLLGVLAQSTAALATVAGAAVGGPVGAEIGAGVAAEAQNYLNQHQAVMATLDPATQATVKIAVSAIAAKIAAPGSTTAATAAAAAASTTAVDAAKT